MNLFYSSSIQHRSLGRPFSSVRIDYCPLDPAVRYRLRMRSRGCLPGQSVSSYLFFSSIHSLYSFRGLLLVSRSWFIGRWRRAHPLNENFPTYWGANLLPLHHRFTLDPVFSSASRWIDCYISSSSSLLQNFPLLHSYLEVVPPPPAPVFLPELLQSLCRIS